MTDEAALSLAKAFVSRNVVIGVVVQYMIIYVLIKVVASKKKKSRESWHIKAKSRLKSSKYVVLASLQGQNTSWLKSEPDQKTIKILK